MYLKLNETLNRFIKPTKLSGNIHTDSEKKIL